jgi:malonyl CoA-acyl carrier protein transacylase
MNTDRRSKVSDAVRVNDSFDHKLTRALEAAPAVAVPEDFAKRAASRIPAAALAARTSVPAGYSVGMRFALVAAALLFVTIVVLAPSASTGPAQHHWVEVGLEIEFAALTAWLALRSRLQA